MTTRYVLGFLLALGVAGPAHALESDDPACRDPGFMEEALAAIRATDPGSIINTELRTLLESDLSGAVLERPEAVSKGPDYLGCAYDVVRPEGRTRVFAKKSTEGGAVKWTVIPPL